MPDINFDQLAERFKKNIYGTTKGRIRLEVLWRDICETIPSLQSHQPLTLLDAGCGMAQLSVRLALQGHHLVLNDISRTMLDTACNLLAQHHIKYEYTVLHQPLQQLGDGYTDYFDLVMNHAVLEWLQDPRSAVNDLVGLVKPGGYLSLMFYNIHSLVYRNLVRGNLHKVACGDWSGTGKDSLTPINPLEPNEVLQWLIDTGVSIKLKSGVRVFQDYLLRNIRDKLSDEDIVKTEIEYSRKEPYLNLGRYIHVICKKPL
jgi:S-adenosylmethionine-dependent methyltransferase